MDASGARARSNSVSPQYDAQNTPSFRPSTTVSSQGRRPSMQAEDKGPNGRESTHKPDGSQPSETSSVDLEMDEMSDAGCTDDEEVGLTEDTRKKRRRRRKQRSTHLDEEASAIPLTRKEERKLADMAVIRSSAVNGLLIGLWYIFSLTISIYNQWMFSGGHLNFHFPLFTTCAHMVVQFSLASTVLFFLPHFRPKSPEQSQEAGSLRRPIMTAKFYLTRIGPCGAATGLDIGLGNMSMIWISLTFFTMCKSSSLAFVLLFAFVFRLESPSLKLVLIIATMTGGVIMMVFGETDFGLKGFILVILSSFFSGFRWALTQILLLRNPATSNPFSSIFFLAPMMFITLFVIAVPVEGFTNLGHGLQGLVAEKGLVMGILIILFPGVLAFCMTSAEFALLKRTSVVTLSICGIFKEVVTISAAEIVYHDPLTPINISGLLVTIVSIGAYNYIKIKKMREDARDEVKGGGEAANSEDVGAADERQGMLANRADRH